MKKIWINSLIISLGFLTFVNAAEKSSFKAKEIKNIIFIIEAEDDVVPSENNELLDFMPSIQKRQVDLDTVVIDLPEFIDFSGLNRLVIFLDYLVDADKQHRKKREPLDLDDNLEQIVDIITHGGWTPEETMINFFEMALLSDYLQVEVKFKSDFCRTNVPYVQQNRGLLSLNVAFFFINQVAKIMVENRLSTDNILTLLDDKLLAFEDYGDSYERLLEYFFEVAVPFQNKIFMQALAFEADLLFDFDIDGQDDSQNEEQDQALEASSAAPAIAKHVSGSTLFPESELFACPECVELFSSAADLFGHYTKMHKKESSSKKGPAFSEQRQAKKKKYDSDDDDDDEMN